ncbi:MAG: GNAT family N-acetyltransferase, partial [Pseudomonadota bacterium]
ESRPLLGLSHWLWQGMAMIEITLRPASTSDSAMLLKWRNDPVTRASSLTQEAVSAEDHEIWFGRSLRSKRRTVWIAESQGVPIGTARLDAHQGYDELSWTIAPSARGKGYGKAMVAAALKQTQGPVRARIRIENKASEAVARACGFDFMVAEGGMGTWLFRSS